MLRGLTRGIGEQFDDLSRRHRIISADVLDAWFPPAPGVLDALREHLPWLVRTSPPTQCAGMLQAIGSARGLDVDGLVPAAGSSALIFLAFPRWLSPSSRALVLDPSYGEYAHVLERVVGCRVTRFPLARQDGYRVNLDRLATRGDGVVQLAEAEQAQGKPLMHAGVVRSQ